MSRHILITGGAGLIGSHLTEMLQQKGYDVAHLSRSRTGEEKVKTYLWQISKNVLEQGAVENAEAIVHLAGANISGKRWTESRKEKLVKSRIDSSQLLFQKLKLLKHQVKCVVSASGINYYGEDTGDKLMTEDMPAGKDFIGDLCLKWEQAVRKIDKLNIRTVQLRTGLALSRRGGFLAPLLPLVRSGFGSPIGGGAQYLSWIHIDDLCRMYIHAIENPDVRGPFNAAAPHPEQNKPFMKKLARSVRRPLIMPKVPGLAVKLALGEMGALVLGGVKASSEKIQSAGFTFLYPYLEDALADLFKNPKNTPRKPSRR